MPLGREVGLGPGHIVLDGDPAVPPRRARPSIFGPCLLWPNDRPSQLLLSTCWKQKCASMPYRRVPSQESAALWFRLRHLELIVSTATAFTLMRILTLRLGTRSNVNFKYSGPVREA